MCCFVSENIHTTNRRDNWNFLGVGVLQDHDKTDKLKEMYEV